MLTYIELVYAQSFEKMDENYQEIVSLVHILIQSYSNSSLPFGESLSKFRGQVIFEIKPPSIFLGHGICCSTNTSIVEDDLVDEVAVLRALEFGNGAGELGNV